MKRCSEFVFGLFGAAKSPLIPALPDELYKHILTESLEQAWTAPDNLQLRLAVACMLVCRHWLGTLVPAALKSLRYLGCGALPLPRFLETVSPFARHLDLKLIQFASYDTTKSGGTSGATARLLYQMPNLTALRYCGQVNLGKEWTYTLSFSRFTALRSLLLYDVNFGPQHLVPIVTRLTELGVLSRTDVIGGVLVSQMTNLRALSAPFQYRMPIDCLKPLTSLTHLDITGVPQQTGYASVTPAQRMHALRDLTQLTSLACDGNYRKDAESWTRANVARNMPSVKRLTVNTQRDLSLMNLSDLRLPLFAQLCQDI